MEEQGALQLYTIPDHAPWRAKHCGLPGDARKKVSPRGTARPLGAISHHMDAVGRPI